MWTGQLLLFGLFHFHSIWDLKAAARRWIREGVRESAGVRAWPMVAPRGDNRPAATALALS